MCMGALRTCNISSKLCAASCFSSETLLAKRRIEKRPKAGICRNLSADQHLKLLQSQMYSP